MARKLVQAAILLALAVLVTYWTHADSARRVQGRDVRVIDGDTLAWGKERVRLQGIDAPEIHAPACAAELERGQEARKMLEAMVRDGREIVIHATDERDRYGRRLGWLTVDGRDAGAALMARGLARPYFGQDAPGWC